MEQVHILNGDALKMRFPGSIPGKIIVARECMIEGPVGGDTIDDIFNSRKKFFESIGVSNEEYEHRVIEEFLKISELDPGKNYEINLWFEDDLFCQTNMWFVLKILSELNYDYAVYLVRPYRSPEYGFGGLKKYDLVKSFQKKKKIHGEFYGKMGIIWNLYQDKEHDSMVDLVRAFGKEYEYIMPALNAEKEKYSTESIAGRPEKTLTTLILKYGKDDFPSIFREFCKIEAIYGYGDAQVKRLIDTILNK